MNYTYTKSNGETHTVKPPGLGPDLQVGMLVYQDCQDMKSMGLLCILLNEPGIHTETDAVRHYAAFRREYHEANKAAQELDGVPGRTQTAKK